MSFNEIKHYRKFISVLESIIDARNEDLKTLEKIVDTLQKENRVLMQQLGHEEVQETPLRSKINFDSP